MKIVFKNYTKLNEQQTQTVLNLRNSEYIRLNMKTTHTIELADHIKWLASLKNSSKQEHFAIFLDNNIVGACSWAEDENSKVSWGIYFTNSINPLISSLSAYLFINYLFELKNNNTIFSYIRKENTLAYGFNKNFGFTLYDEDINFYYLSLSKSQWIKRDNKRFITSLKKYLGKIAYRFE